jgi:hypothetical protein
MEAIQAIDQGWQTYGLLGGLATMLTLAVGLYKQPMIQNAVPNKMKWINLGPIPKLIAIFATACVGSGFLAYLGGASVVAAVGLGISAGFAAIGMRETKETITKGSANGYIPSTISRGVSLKTKLELPK